MARQGTVGTVMPRLFTCAQKAPDTPSEQELPIKEGDMDGANGFAFRLPTPKTYKVFIHTLLLPCPSYLPQSGLPTVHFIVPL